MLCSVNGHFWYYKEGYGRKGISYTCEYYIYMNLSLAGCVT